MATEGMVDALRRVHGLVTRPGVVVDLHPTAEPGVLRVGDVVAGLVESEAGSRRHQAATDAIATAVAAGWFVVEEPSTFDFLTWGDTVEELCDYVLAHWRDTAIAPATMARARALLAPGMTPHVRERVAACRLVPR
jgi:hypothetical protein